MKLLLETPRSNHAVIIHIHGHMLNNDPECFELFRYLDSFVISVGVGRDNIKIL